MVFIALPVLQRNQRDTQRKNDMSRLLSVVQSYQSNNKGNVPENLEGYFRTNYLNSGGNTFMDPDGSLYVFANGSIGTVPPIFKSASGNTAIWRFTGAKCDGENTVTVNGSNKIAFSMKLEGGGVYCINN